MADSDHLSDLADAEQEKLPDLSQYDIPSSQELVCTGCQITSKAQDPVEAMKGDKGLKRKAPWGKTSTRKVRCRRSGTKLRVIRRTGDWCRVCYNIWRLR